MPAKKTLRSRATTSILAHKGIAWGTLAAIVTILGVLLPGGYWVWHLIEMVDHASQTYETKTDSDAKFKEALGQIATLRNENKDLKRGAAWTGVGVANLQATTMRNRVNDCDIRRERQPAMTSLERQACKQYDQEFDDAKRRFADAQAMANAVSR